MEKQTGAAAAKRSQAKCRIVAGLLAASVAVTTLVFDLHFDIPVDGEAFGIEFVTFLPVNLAAATIGAWMGVCLMAKIRASESDGRSEKDEGVVLRHDGKMILLSSACGAAFGLAAVTPLLGVWFGLIGAAIVGAAIVLLFLPIRRAMR